MTAVQRCVYERFSRRRLGDHRGVYMDVNTRLFFGSDTIPMAPSKARHLQSRKVTQIVPYFEHLESHLTTHNWHKQIADLQTCMESGNRNDALAEKLDRRRIAGCQYAAGKLQRYPKPPYSPEIARLRNIESLLKLAMFQIRNPSDNYSEAMDKLQLKLGSLEIEIPPTIQEIRQLRKANMQVLKAMEIDEFKKWNRAIKIPRLFDRNV